MPLQEARTMLQALKRKTDAGADLFELNEELLECMDVVRDTTDSVTVADREILTELKQLADSRQKQFQDHF